MRIGLSAEKYLCEQDGSERRRFALCTEYGWVGDEEEEDGDGDGDEPEGWRKLRRVHGREGWISWEKRAVGCRLARALR